jgi:hypothetical protein
MISSVTLLSYSTYAQVDTTDSVKITQAERIIDKYSNKVYHTVTEIVDDLKGPAKEMFNYVVKLEIIKGFGMLLPLFFAIIFLILIVSEYKRISNILNSTNVVNTFNKREGPLHEDNITPQMIIYLVSFIFMAIVSLFSTYDGVLHLFAPEWYAVKEIIGIIN